jgi:hypothetical protein
MAHDITHDIPNEIPNETPHDIPHDMSDLCPQTQASFGTVPDELTTREQWICFRIGEKEGRTTKLPINPHSGGFASSTDPETWGRFHEAKAYHDLRSTTTDGIGFVFTDADQFVGVDLDDCRDLATGHIDEWAREIVQTIGSYAETSPSGTGIHIIVRGAVPDGGNRKGGVEIYETGRYFTVTGDVLGLDGKRYDEITSNPAGLERVHREHVGGRVDERSDDREPEEIADAFGDDTDDGTDGAGPASLGRTLGEWRRLDPTLHELLQSGNPDGVYDSTSEADLACVIRLLHLEYGDGEIAGILRRYRGREKVNERDDYIALTIRAGRNALSGTATEPSVEADRGEAEMLCHWKIRHFAVAHGICGPDEFKQQGNEDEGFYPGFNRTRWNLTVKTLDNAEIDHGRSVHEDGEWEAKAAQDRFDAGQGVAK